MRKRDIVLLGGGHGNCQVLKVLKPLSDQFKISLISEADTSYYSGMLPGCIANQYQEKEIQVDLKEVAAKNGAGFIQKRATRISPKECKVFLEDGKEISYDILSVNIGSRTLGTDNIPGVWKYSLTTRPVNYLLDKIEEKEKSLKQRGENPVVIIAGGGVSAVELSFAMKARWEKVFPSISITMLNSKDSVLNNQPRAGKKIEEELRAKGVNIIHKAEVLEVTEKGVMYKIKEEVAFENGNVVLWCTGAESQDIFEKSGMKVDRRGFMNVNKYLQNVEYNNIFGAGDCIRIIDFEEGFPPKAGVYAVSEGLIVAENIKRFLKWKSLKEYEPQSDFLKLINMGDGNALFVKYGFAFKSSVFFNLKDYIDKKFMKTM